MTVAIHIDDVSMTYVSPKATNHVLERVSYEVEEHHFVSIVGPSGVGKTTLLKALIGQLPMVNTRARLEAAMEAGGRTAAGRNS